MSLLSFFGIQAKAAEDLKVGDAAPLFEVKTDANQLFKMQDRAGKWTVLYFYPKADTPGCTKQACLFRDKIGEIRKLNADVFGVSANSVEQQAEFKTKFHLNFTLLADDDAKVIKLYGTKMPLLSLSKRWTFIIDPTLKIRDINHDSDPIRDALDVAAKIQAFL